MLILSGFSNTPLDGDCFTGRSLLAAIRQSQGKIKKVGAKLNDYKDSESSVVYPPVLKSLTRRGHGGSIEPQEEASTELLTPPL